MASEHVSSATMEKASIAKSFLEKHMANKIDAVREQKERFV
jgi:hypothetical protein